MDMGGRCNTDAYQRISSPIPLRPLLIHRGASRTCTMAVTPPGKSSWPQINVESALKLAPNKYKHRYILGPHHHASRPFQPPARDLLPGLFLRGPLLSRGRRNQGSSQSLPNSLMGGGTSDPSHCAINHVKKAIKAEDPSHPSPTTICREHTGTMPSTLLTSCQSVVTLRPQPVDSQTVNSHSLPSPNDAASPTHHQRQPQTWPSPIPFTRQGRKKVLAHARGREGNPGG